MKENMTTNNSKITEINKVLLDVIQIVRKGESLFFEVSFEGALCYVRLFPFQEKLLERYISKKRIACVYRGLDELERPILNQDRGELIDELYEEDTVHTFNYVSSEIDIKGDFRREYHLLRDEYGLKHRFFGKLTENQKVPNTKIKVYIQSINENNNTLVLALYNPQMDSKEKIFYNAEKIFADICEIDNKEKYFDCYFVNDCTLNSKLKSDLVGQYNGKSNLWLFTYMNILDQEVIVSCIRCHQIEELATVCQIMLKLQKWMVEGSSYLDNFGEETKNTTLSKSEYQIQKFSRFLLAIDVIRRGDSNRYIDDTIKSINGKECIDSHCYECVDVMIKIFRICPEYLTQDICTTCKMMESLLSIKDSELKYSMGVITSLLTIQVNTDISKMRSGTIRSNDIDTTQVLLFNEVLSLLCILIIIFSDEKYYNEIELRTYKARFFRFLSFVCHEDMQNIMIKAGVDALVGVIDTGNIFTWKNAANINPIALCNLTTQATVLDCNTDNDYCYLKSTGKSGVIRLDSTGFTIVPYKQCAINYKNNPDFLSDINVINHCDTLPVKIGTMLNIAPFYMEDDAVFQFLLWQAVAKHPEKLRPKIDLPKPQLGDIVRVCVKEQTQPDHLKNLLFVKVDDNRFQTVDGVMTPQDVTKKWVEDIRKIFKEGQLFFAEVSKIKEGDKYQFSIKKELSMYETENSKIEDDIKCILLNKGFVKDLTSLPSTFIQELILLIDMRIRKETIHMHKLSLIGYAYILSALVSDPKSYYYDFLLRYYAAIHKFVSNQHSDVEIKFHDTINDKFANIGCRRCLVELLSFVNNQDANGLKSLQVLAEEESSNDAGKLAAMLVAYIYAMKAGLSGSSIATIKDEINNYIVNSDKLDLSALYTEASIEQELVTRDTDKKEVCVSTPENNDEISESNDIEVIEVTTVDDAIIQESISYAERETLILDIFGDGNLIVRENSSLSNTDNTIMQITLPSYVANGVLLLVDNDGGVCKIQIKEFFNLDLQIKKESKINPYNVKYHFVAPTDCIVGSVVTCTNRKYIEFYNTVELPISDFHRLEYKHNDYEETIRVQSFILPLCCDIEGLDKCLNKSIEISNIPTSVKDGLQSYNVMI